VPGWGGRALDLGGRGPGELADASEQSDRRAERRARHREPPTTAEPLTAPEDRADIQGFRVILARQPQRPAECVEVVHGPSPSNAGSWSSAEIRSLASARELVLFTVPSVIPRSSATVASGRSNR